MQIGEKTIQAMKELAGEQIDTYAGKINTAFLKATDEKLKIILAFDIALSKLMIGGIDLDATISFTESKVKEKVSTTVVENQVDLPLVDRIYPLKDTRMEYPVKGE